MSQELSKRNCIEYMYKNRDCLLKELERVFKRETGGVRVHASAAMTNTFNAHSTNTSNGFVNMAIHITSPAFQGGYGLSSIRKLATVIFDTFGIIINNEDDTMLRRIAINSRDGLVYIITKQDIVEIFDNGVSSL